MIYLLTVKEILILSNNINLFTKSIIIQGNYILTRNYIHFKEPYQFFQGNIFSFNEIYHSGKLYPFKEISLFKKHIFVQVQGHTFIQGNHIYRTLLHSRSSRKIYSKIVPSHFMIIISFTINSSWIKYSYNFFLVEGWKNCWYDRGFHIIITVCVVFATIVRRNTTRSASCFWHYIFAKIWYVCQRAVYI